MSQRDAEGAGENRPRHDHRRRLDLGGLLIAAALLIFAVMIAFDAASYPPRSNYGRFGPEIFPYIVAAGLGVFGVMTVLMALRGEFPEREPLNVGPVAWIIATLLAQAVLLYAGAGFIIASGVLFGGAARGFGRRPVWLTFAVGFAISVLLYILFRQGLNLSLPSGLVEPTVDRLFR